MSTRPNSAWARVDQRVDVGALGDVDPLHDRDAALSLDLVGGGLRAGLVDVAADDRRARGGEHVRGGLADPARDTREHRNLTRQVEQILHACHENPFGRSGCNPAGAYATDRRGSLGLPASSARYARASGRSPTMGA